MSKSFRVRFHLFGAWNIIIILFWKFFTSASADGRLSDSTFPQISRTLPSILADLYSSVVWMVSTCVLSDSSSPFTNPLLTVPRYRLQLVSFSSLWFTFFLFPCKFQVLISLFSFLWFYSVVCRDGKVHNSAGSQFCCCSGRLDKIRWSVCTPCVFFSSALSGGLLREFEGQQVSSGLQGSSQHSNRS